MSQKIKGRRWRALEQRTYFAPSDHGASISELETAVKTVESCDDHLEKAEFGIDDAVLAKPIKIARISLKKEAGFLRDVIEILKPVKK